MRLFHPHNSHPIIQRKFQNWIKTTLRKGTYNSYCSEVISNNENQLDNSENKVC